MLFGKQPLNLPFPQHFANNWHDLNVPIWRHLTKCVRFGFRPQRKIIILCKVLSTTYLCIHNIQRKTLLAQVLMMEWDKSLPEVERVAQICSKKDFSLASLFLFEWSSPKKFQRREQIRSLTSLKFHSYHFIYSQLCTRHPHGSWENAQLAFRELWRRPGTVFLQSSCCNHSRCNELQWMNI